MNKVYDMSTRRILNPDPEAHEESTHGLTFDATLYALQLHLQLVIPESRPKRQIPHELVMADPNAFIEKMS